MIKILTISAALLITSIIPSIAIASDACTKIKFSVNNKVGSPIKVTKVSYYNKDSGKWRTENVNNPTCANNQICKTNNNKLTDSEGRDLTSFKFKYKILRSNGKYSKVKTTPVFTANNARCRANRTYGGKHWKIN